MLTFRLDKTLVPMKSSSLYFWINLNYIHKVELASKVTTILRSRNVFQIDQINIIIKLLRLDQDKYYYNQLIDNKYNNDIVA